MADIKFFVGSSNLPLAKKVSQELGIPLARCEIFHFSNNETRIRIEENVKGKTCLIFQSLSTPVDEYWAETLFFLDALGRSGAKKIIGIIPWLGYQKQDKQFRSGEAVSVAAVIKTFEAMSMDKMITINFHSKNILEYFQNPPVVLSAFPLFLTEIKRQIGQDSSSFVMAAPDQGAYWEREFSRNLKIPLVQVVKDRDRQTSLIPYSSLRIKGKVKGKKVIIVDDNVYTGSTLMQNAKFLKSLGAVKVYCFVTHPIMAGDSPWLLQKSSIDSLTVTDTIFTPIARRFPKLKIISVAKIITHAIRKMNLG
jgi:ribose-phosphate pyrophosphokinase